jgi:hypothetical protein
MGDEADAAQDVELSCKITRKTAPQLRVPVLPEEERAIRAQASAAGLPVAAFLRNAALGYPIHGILDHREVAELARINGDQGRLGGLLKLWLTNDEKIGAFDDPRALRQRISGLLTQIIAVQNELQSIMARVVRQ